jgi:CheY-like chemotaxis protein
MDEQGATTICEKFLKEKPLDDLYDEVIIPALSLAEEDRHRGNLDEVKQQFIVQNTRSLLDEMAKRAEDLAAGENAGTNARSSNAEGKIMLEGVGPVEVLCLPARDEADELAAYMLRQLLQKRGLGVKALTAGISPSEAIEEVNRSQPKVVCVAAVPPFAYMQTRYFCRRLRNQFRRIRITAALLTEKEPNGTTHGQMVPAADETVASLKEAVATVVSLAQAQALQTAKASAT